MVEQIDLSDRPAVAKIVMLYREILNRPADPDALRSYLAELKKGTPLATLARISLSSKEYAARDGQTSLSADEVSCIAAQIADKIERTDESEWPSLLASLVEGGRAPVDLPGAYRWWLADFERPLLLNRQILDARVRAVGTKPTFAFVMILTGSSPRDVMKTIATIRAQIYPNLELFVVARHRWARLLRIFLRVWDRRIRLLRSVEPDPVGGLLLQSAHGCHSDFTALVRSGDRLSPLATLEFAEAYQRNAALSVIYADSDVADAHGKRHSPEFRSKWDPDRFLAGEDLGPLVMYSNKSIRRLAELYSQTGPDSEFEFCSQIALSTEAECIGHVPRVLYHQKSSHVKDRERTEERMECLYPMAAKRGAGLVPVLDSRNRPRFRLFYPVPEPAPLVSIIIPTRERVDLLSRCIEAIFATTNYQAFEIVLVDNGSYESKTLEYYSEIKSHPLVQFIAYPGEFNWGAMNNAGAHASRGQVFVLLNNDTEVLETDWLNELVGQVLRPEIGVVGARLLYPDRSLQHGGLVTTPRGAAQHIMRHAPPDDPGYMNLLSTVREVSAVTGACLAIRRDVFEEVGGIEQSHLTVACSDVDLCLRVRSKGYRVLWTPYATLFHKELATRGSDDTPEKLDRARKEEAYMAKEWAVYLKQDPFWSPNMAAEEDVSAILAIPPRSYLPL